MFIHTVPSENNVNQEGHNGAFLTDVLNACLVRLKYNQDMLSCSENVAAIECITNAITYLNRRQTRYYNKKVLDTPKSNSKTICNSYSIINTDEELKMAESWLDKFKNALEIIDAENNPKLPLAERYISKTQKDKYKTKIAEFEYNIKTYKNSVNQNKP